MRALLWPLFARSAWAQPANVVADTTGEGAALASVCLFGVVPDKYCDFGHDKSRRCSGFCSLGRRGLSQPLRWRARHVRALLWPLFSRSA
jgi:hypothetical protein